MVLRMNKAMQQIVAACIPDMVALPIASRFESIRNLSARYPLPDALSQILRSGFQYHSGCFFLSKLLSGVASVSVENFPDRTGYECFVNKLHIEDYVEGDQLEIALTFVVQFIRQFHDKNPTENLRAILGVNESDCVVRFHRVRSGEAWLAADIEDFLDEGILVMDSKE